MNDPIHRSDLSDISHSFVSQADISGKSVGDRLKDALSGRDLRWLSRQTDIASSTLSDYSRGVVPRTDKAVRIANALGTTVEWLFAGQGKPSANPLGETEAAFVMLPRYDISAFTQKGKPEPLDITPFRVEWLNRALGTATSLWLTSMPNNNMRKVAREGDILICQDFQADLLEGKVYILMLDSSVIIRRVALQPGKYLLGADDEMTPPITIERYDPPILGEGLVPVARVLGTFNLQPA